MTTPATQLKLGLFALCAIVAIVAAALGLGLHARTPTVRYHTYFDESVSGLDIGSSVDFRGVRIGAVGAIGIAPDHVHIDVALDLVQARLSELDLVRNVPVQAQLDASGITGVKYVDLEPKNDEVPAVLAFPPDLHYIPARPSLLYSLEGQAARVGRRVPVLVERAVEVVDKLGGLLDEFRDAHVAGQIRSAIAHADAAVADVRHLVHGVDSAELAARARGAFARLDAAIATAREAIARLDSGDELDRTVRDVGDAARGFRELVEQVEEQPDVLVKGRGRSHKP